MTPPLTLDRHQKLKLAVLDMYNGEANQGMRAIGEILDNYKYFFDVEVFDVRQHCELPDLSYDIYISTGGPGNPLEGDGVWDRAYGQWIDSVWDWNQAHAERPKFVFFICHSFQMACHHFQIAEVLPRKSMSFGVFPVHMTEFGRSEPYFEGLDDPFYIADFRNYQVVKADWDKIELMGARILAREKVRPHVPLERAIMAVRFSPEMFGTQFHPEADPKGMLRHFEQEERKAQVLKEHGMDKFMTMLDGLNDPRQIPLTHKTILPNFLEQAIGTLASFKVLA